MTATDRKKLFEDWSDPECGDEYTFKIEKKTIQQGRTFSSQAMDEISVLVSLFISARIVARWNKTQEPPTALSVHLRVLLG